jgi:hypothetical protein
MALLSPAGAVLSRNAGEEIQFHTLGVLQREHGGRAKCTVHDGLIATAPCQISAKQFLRVEAVLTLPFYFSRGFLHAPYGSSRCCCFCCFSWFFLCIPDDPRSFDGTRPRCDPIKRCWRSRCRHANSSRNPGTIVVNAKERRLYLVLDGGKAMKYGVGVGRPGFEWGGTKTVTRKQEWPTWTPPAQMLKRRPDLPRFMPGGPENPMGARAMYLGSSLYRIHGSNEPETIGQAVSSGCIRMLNDDVIDLYTRVKVGTQVVVVR